MIYTQLKKRQGFGTILEFITGYGTINLFTSVPEYKLSKHLKLMVHTVTEKI